jgi:hypothetical protein
MEGRTYFSPFGNPEKDAKRAIQGTLWRKNRRLIFVVY